MMLASRDAQAVQQNNVDALYPSTLVRLQRLKGAITIE